MGHTALTPYSSCLTMYSPENLLPDGGLAALHRVQCTLHVEWYFPVYSDTKANNLVRLRPAPVMKLSKPLLTHCCCHQYTYMPPVPVSLHE